MNIIPSGLMLDSVPTKAPYENVELRATLEKAVDDADLNVTERWALNKKFFPDGGGFELFPKGKDSAEFSYYLSPKQADSFDKVIKDMNIDTPKRISMSVDHIQVKKSANNYLDNLNSALKKLGSVLKGKV